MPMVVRLRDPAGVARAAAVQVVEAAFKAIHQHGDFHLVLAGGNTPRAAYELLAGELSTEIDWRRVRLYFGDERCVPPDDPRSNFRMVRETLMDPLRLPNSTVRRIAGELAPPAAAAEYDDEIRRLVRERQVAFDLVLLGMGEEGHCASLFPGSTALEETSHMAQAVTVAAQPPERVTLTPPAFAASRQILFLVTGASKAGALSQVFGGDDLPAARISQLAPTQFLTDEAAAAGLPK
ncbi:MAG: 6-phosphogluconolactonase [Candidatus Dormibacteria bacterium]